ncbi:hypothetical protein BHC47_11590 [Snodgrassella alvi]|uniref:Uncharacterized protein n=1 Tax=Snodgrassella alvi TaxID=1196083 RepID=A0A2N9Y4J5_9NEIS|nr:hypothetical protein BHC56_07970 [Snodgrassella alvi]PIT62914.1 hypothetical protein BHC47_11590 [Snodgrassella alvi]
MADRVNNNSCKHNDAWLQTFQPYIYMKKHKILTVSRKHNPILMFFCTICKSGIKNQAGC